MNAASSHDPENSHDENLHGENSHGENSHGRGNMEDSGGRHWHAEQRRMPEWPARVVLIGFFLLSVAVLTYSIRPLETSLHHEFSSWLSKTEPLLNKKPNISSSESTRTQSPTAAERVPTITLEIGTLEIGTSEIASHQIGRRGSSGSEIYGLGPSSDPESIPHVLRILELIEEAGVFNLKQSQVAAGGEFAKIEVHAPDRNFQIVLSGDDVRSNVKALLLLRLFKEYARPQTVLAAAASAETPAAVSQAGSSPEAANWTTSEKSASSVSSAASTAPSSSL